MSWRQIVPVKCPCEGGIILEVNWNDVQSVTDLERARRNGSTGTTLLLVKRLTLPFLCYKQFVCSYFLVIAFVTCAALPVFGQCPPTDPAGTESEIQTLEDRLIFHDAIRKWFELKLDQPRCGQTSIQLVRGGRDSNPLEVLRGCRITSRGALGFSPTGYYSLPIYHNVQQAESAGTCGRQLPFPNFGTAKPDKAVREYRVEMRVDNRPGDHPILFSVSYAGKELKPWQAYADYFLTGSFVLDGQCGEGFVVDKVFGTPEASPSHFGEPRTSDDRAMFDPERAAASGKRDLILGFTCVRP